MDKIIIGKTLKPQGLLGELKILPHTSDIERFYSLKEVYVGDSKEPIRVHGVRIGSGTDVYCYLDKVNDRNAAEKYRGKELSVLREDAQKPEGSYFVCDILGCEVCFSDNGQSLGKVIDVLQNTNVDIYWVVPEGKKKGVLFPALETVFENIDTEHKKITVNREKFEEVASYEE